MKRVSAAEYVRNFSALADAALMEPFVVTRNGRDRLVVASVEQYKHILSMAILATNDPAESERLGKLLKQIA